MHTYAWTCLNFLFHYIWHENIKLRLIDQTLCISAIVFLVFSWLYVAFNLYQVVWNM